MSLRIALTCKDSWVECPGYLELMNIQRSFAIKVNPVGLPIGAHFTQVSVHSANSITLICFLDLETKIDDDMSVDINSMLCWWWL